MAAMSETVQNGERTNHLFQKGHPRFGGRPPGKSNRSVELREQRLADAELTANLAIGDFQGSAHEFLVHVYKNGKVPMAARIDCAKAAVSFEKAKLAAIAIVDDAAKLTVTIRDLRSEKLISHGDVVNLPPQIIEILVDHTESDT